MTARLFFDLRAQLVRSRRDQGKSVAELALQIGCSMRSLDRWESAQAIPGADDLCRWAGSLQLVVTLVSDTCVKAPAPEPSLSAEAAHG